MGAEQRLPRELDELSPGWLTGVLRRSSVLPPSADVEAIDVRILAAGEGLMSTVARLAVTYSPPSQGPATLVVKLPTGRAANRAMAEKYRLFQREARFYDELAMHIGITTPRCHLCAYDDETGDSILLLDDLLADEGRAFDPSDRGHVRLAVASLAQMHARWWADVGTAPPAWVPRLDGQLWAEHETMFASAWEAFLTRRPAHEHPALHELGPDLVASLPSLRQRLARPPATLVHFDFRASNLFIRPDGTTPKLAVVDWQPLSVARGAYDLGYFLSQSLPIAIRRELETELLESYHSTLVAHGVRAYEPHALVEDYRLSVAYTSSYAVATALIDLGDAAGSRYAREVLDRADAAARDLGVADALAALRAVRG